MSDYSRKPAKSQASPLNLQILDGGKEIEQGFFCRILLRVAGGDDLDRAVLHCGNDEIVAEVFHISDAAPVGNGADRFKGEGVSVVGVLFCAKEYLIGGGQKQPAVPHLCNILLQNLALAFDIGEAERSVRTK